MKKTIKTALFLLLALTYLNEGHAQGRKIMYLQTYDWAPYHFGLQAGVNFMDYKLIMKENYQNEMHYDFDDLSNMSGIGQEGFQYYQILSVERDTTGSIKHIPKPGFSVGLVGDMRLGDYFNLRFSPTFSLSEINVGYTLQIHYTDTILTRVTTSHHPYLCCLEFPFHLKYRSKRYNNIGVYLLTGLNPKVYFRSKTVDWIKTKPLDVAFEVGTGLDIYNQWFKMGVELRFAFGIFNILADDQVSYYGHPLEGLKNKQLLLSFTFE